MCTLPFGGLRGREHPGTPQLETGGARGVSGGATVHGVNVAAPPGSPVAEEHLLHQRSVPGTWKTADTSHKTTITGATLQAQHRFYPKGAQLCLLLLHLQLSLSLTNALPPDRSYIRF